MTKSFLKRRQKIQWKKERQEEEELEAKGNSYCTEGGRQEDYNLLCMFGLCGGGGRSKVQLSSLKVILQILQRWSPNKISCSQYS